MRKGFNGLEALCEKDRSYTTDERKLETLVRKAVSYRVARTGEPRERFLDTRSRIDGFVLHG